MTVSALQIVLVTLVAFICSVQKYGFQIINLMCVLPAWVVGIIMGDPMTGLSVGATVQLMSLGVAGLGGASVPDYPTAAIIGTVVAISSGQGAEVGLAVGIAVGMLCVQLDVIVKILAGFIARKAEALAAAGNYVGMKRVLLVDPVLYGLVGTIPTFIVLLFGADTVNAILNAMPAWFTTGLNIAGGMLPVVGMAMLLNFMPSKKFISFVIVGYVLSAYLKIGVLPIALLGIAAAYEYYKLQSQMKDMKVSANAEGMLEDE